MTAPTMPAGSHVDAPTGRHRIRSFLGRGGEGEAYLLDDPHGQPCVLKLYPPEAAADFGAVRARVAGLTGLALWAESPVLAGAPRVAVEVAGRPGYLAGFVEGVSLLEYGKNHPGDLAGALRSMAALAAGVHVLERRGFVHSDISLANVRVHLMQDIERTAMIDFDGGRVPEWGLPAGVIGTPGAIAPELFLPHTVPTIESDRYALACAIHTALLFRAPAAPHMSAGASVRTQTAVAGRNCWVEVADAQAGGMPIYTLSAALRRMLRRGLSSDPSVRPTAAEWYQALYDAAGRVYACWKCDVEHVADPEQAVCGVCGASPKIEIAVGGKIVPLHAPVAMIGRALLGHPNVSSEHALLSWNGFEPILTDRGSRHGTELWDGHQWRQLASNVPLVIRTYDRLRFAGEVEAQVA